MSNCFDKFIDCCKATFHNILKLFTCCIPSYPVYSIIKDERNKNQPQPTTGNTIENINKNTYTERKHLIHRYNHYDSIRVYTDEYQKFITDSDSNDLVS